MKRLWEAAFAASGILCIVIITGCDPGAPRALDAEFTVAEDAQLQQQLSVHNPRGESLSYEVIEPPAHGSLTIDESTGEFAYAPQADFLRHRRVRLSRARYPGRVQHGDGHPDHHFGARCPTGGFGFRHAQ